MNSRRKEILALVSKNGQITVHDLAERFNVSLVTIRSDLKTLEEMNLLVRTHGGAAVPSTDDISYRLGIDYDKKQRIAVKAVELVEEGDTILLESGSCIALMARELKSFSSLNVLTNNAFVARQLKGAAGVKVVLLGGEFQDESETMIGPMVREYLRYYNFTKIFLGMDGYTVDKGITCRDMARAEVLKEFMGYGVDVTILSDSSKFGTLGVRTFAEPKDISTIITDSDISLEYSDAVRNAGIRLVTV